MTAERVKYWARHKLASCIRLARECNQDYIETHDKRFKLVRREAMNDAREWRDFLNTL